MSAPMLDPQRLPPDWTPLDELSARLWSNALELRRKVIAEPSFDNICACADSWRAFGTEFLGSTSQ